VLLALLHLSKEPEKFSSVSKSRLLINDLHIIEPHSSGTITKPTNTIETLDSFTLVHKGLGDYQRKLGRV
jgi:hypothetical protein